MVQCRQVVEGGRHIRMSRAQHLLLQLQRHLGQRNRLGISACLIELGEQVTQLYEAGRYAQAIPLAQMSLQLKEEVLGPRHPDVATSLNNLATLYHTMGSYEKAEPLLQR